MSSSTKDIVDDVRRRERDQRNPASLDDWKAVAFCTNKRTSARENWRKSLCTPPSLQVQLETPESDFKFDKRYSFRYPDLADDALSLEQGGCGYVMYLSRIVSYFTSDANYSL
jgi:hypothetical protein